MPVLLVRVLLTAAFVSLYVAGDALGELLLHGPDQVTLVWLPAGVSLSALLLFGRRYWVFIPIAETVVQLVPEPAPSSFIAVTIAANLIPALLAHAFILRFVREDEARFVLRSGYVLLLAAVLLALCSALIGVAGLWSLGMLPIEAVEAGFAKWFVANFFGVLLLTPAVLLLARSRRWAESLDGDAAYGSRAEIWIWATALCLALLLLGHADRATSNYVLGLTALPLALLIWSAMRFRPHINALASLITGLTLSILAGLGLAGFTAPESLTDAVVLLSFLSMIAIVPLLLSAAANQNRLSTRRLLQQARTDDLTGLPNRTGFAALVRAALSAPAAPARLLLYLDLDNFKLINDTAGHSEGDLLIQQLAGTLRAMLGPGEVLARLGGDEFAVLLDDAAPEQRGGRVQALRDAVAQLRFPVDGHVFSVTASIGAVELDAQSDYAHALAQADAACFAAKEMGGNRWILAKHDAAAVNAQTSAMRWAIRINDGIEHDHFRVFCQSILPLAPGPSRGRRFEVLIRLYDPHQDRLLPPGQFVPAAERFRMGPQLDRHVLDRTLRWFESRPDWVELTESCSINLCAASVEDEGFVDYLHQRLASSSVPPQKLCFEITETSAVRDLGEAQRFIDGVRGLGCRLALDDFGTGFCSFAYLNSLDVDYFKIDGSFVRQIGESPLALSIIKAIGDIARSIDKMTIAEFVETPQIREQLAGLGIDYAQGYAIDAPKPIEQYFDELQAALDAAAPSNSSAQPD